MNDENLKVLTPKEAREQGRKGGIASGKARREKKAMKELLNDILDLPLKDGKTDEIKSLEEIEGKKLNGKNVTVEQAMIFMQVLKALKGDTTAFIALRDTSGQKPSDKLDIDGGLPIVIKDDVKE